MPRFTIPAKPDDTNPRRRYKQEVIILLDATMTSEFSVEEDDIGEDLPSTWKETPQSQAKSINWVSSFKLVKKAGNPTGVMKPYTIELDKGGRKLFYYDNGLKDLPYRPAGGNRVQADLQVADPPIGWVD